MSLNLTYTVNELNGHIKKIFDFEHSLKGIKVRGEVSNLSVSSANHVYFTLKDEDASVRCVWFSKGQGIAFKNADKVIVTGNVSLYVKGGDYQLLITDVEYSGIGYWYEKFHKIKTKLEKEGLFDDIHKKPLPKHPKTIGIITSETGAAIDDVLRVLSERYPLAKVLHYPVMVQGVGASKTIAHAIDYINENDLCDVIILTRGGGSAEDLWEFNEEIVARAIFNCSIPLVSAVGHERDISICDFVADVREATPSTAAARVTPDINELIAIIRYYEINLYNLITNMLDANLSQLNMKLSELATHSPQAKLNEYTQRLDYAKRTLKNAIDIIITSKETTFAICSKTITTLHPLKPLEKGYMIAMDDDNNILHSTKEIIKNGKAQLRAIDGIIDIVPKSK